MLKLTAALPLILLAACSNPEKTGRYLIDPPSPPVRVANQLGPTVELRDVSLPEYASGQEVSWQSADGAVRSTPDNLWADNPERAFTLTLARAISDVSGAAVIAEPWPLGEPPQRKLEVRVEKALAQADGIYRLSGRYFVADESGGGTNHARSFDISVPLADAQPGTIALAQSAALSVLAQQIATLDGPGTTFVTRTPRDPFALDPIL
ncbi:membrane integrity-associated transporter subunit PqiC [Paracoccus sp. M683]|uniref:PqiC family protein n=1 Tax=Paracoccus sp. M683 TaxID=2594268 RepID=UPI00117DE1A6|nr:PqiC family protein [Paracoccus sp. M683]TRW98800.1 membrane integrity-associated transporter subunit PqiC [Paracoccus sp. M683]